MPTHVAFSDDSKHSQGRYNSLGLVTLAVANHRAFHDEITALLKESSISSEFKWARLTNAKYRFAAEKMMDFALRNASKLRIDVLIWDMDDARHKGVRGRSDNENLVRMYYHLVAATCGKRWPISNVRWAWYPDEQSSVQWKTLRDCITNKKHRSVEDLFGANPEFERVNLGLKPVKSHEHPFIQLADLFAGLGAYSSGNFPRLKIWQEQQKGPNLFGSNNNTTFSNSEKERFRVITDFRGKCATQNLKIGLESSGGLQSHDPSRFCSTSTGRVVWIDGRIYPIRADRLDHAFGLMKGP